MQTPNKINLTTKRGYILNAFEGDSITREIQKKGEYDTNTLNSLSDVLGAIKPQTSLDVGANIGNHSLVIAKYSRNLIAFEPVKFIFDVLEGNFLLNQLKNAKAINCGLSNKQALAEIFIPENGNLGSSSLELKDGIGNLLEIKTIVGDIYLEENLANSQVDFIKMDVEGHEALALLGLETTIIKNQPLLLLEWKSAKTVAAFKEFDLFNKLFVGYEFYSLTYTSNQKVHLNNSIGFLKRVYYRVVNKRWCLSGFESDKRYTNVYFVPVRYQQVFHQFKYLDR